MASIIKRIMYGNELVGYITNNPDERYVYLDRGLALHFAMSGLIDNAKVVTANDKKSLGGNGINLNDIERINVNIDKMDKEIYNHIDDKLFLKMLCRIVDGMETNNTIEGAVYKLLTKFVDDAELTKYDTFKGINASIFTANTLFSDRVTFAFNWGKQDTFQVVINTLTNEMAFKAAIYGSNTVPRTFTRAIVGTNHALDQVPAILNEILNIEGVKFKEKHIEFREILRREENNSNRIIAAFINLANSDKVVNLLDSSKLARISELEIKKNKAFDTTYSYNIRVNENCNLRFACRVSHRNNVSNTPYDSIIIRALIEKDGTSIPLNLGRLCNKTLLYEITTFELTNMISEMKIGFEAELDKHGY